MPLPSPRRAFSLIELLVVIAIIAILMAILIPAIQRVRESSNQTICGNNLKQLAIAVNSYHAANGSLPPYQGIAQARSGSVAPNANPHAVYGSWFVHLLPHVEQDPLYALILDEVGQFSNAPAMVSAPGGPIITPAVAAVQGPLISPAIPATYNNWNASNPVWTPPTTTTVSTISGNGYTIYSEQTTPGFWSPPKTPDPGTNVAAVYGPGTPAVPAVYGPPGAPINGYVGIYKPETRSTVFTILTCPSDPSMNSDPKAMNGLVYVGQTNGNWGATNYLANYNAIVFGNVTKGFHALPASFRNITDGVSNTILFGEGYSWCNDGNSVGRTALLAWHTTASPATSPTNWGGVHNFGLTYAFTASQSIDVGAGKVPIAGVSGYPNPDDSVNLMFQIQPDPRKKGEGGCDALTAQTGHSALKIALMDGGVRSVSLTIDPRTWYRAMLPRDGEAFEADWPE
jgi:prepilin-type N-terminal cleavage/methylation domain-containing protein